MRTLAVLTREGYRSDIIEREPEEFRGILTRRVDFIGDLDIDADGAFRAYHPDNKSGLDDLRNAKTETGEWCGVVTVNGRPVIQGATDPAPGFYVSPTTLHIPGKAATDPRCYVDAETVPFIVVPPQIAHAVGGVVLGCQARITDTRTNLWVDCVVADSGPRTRDGEASIAAARALHINSSARTGGEDRAIFLYECWPDVPAIVDGIIYHLQPIFGT